MPQAYNWACLPYLMRYALISVYMWIKAYIITCMMSLCTFWCLKMLGCMDFQWMDKNY